MALSIECLCSISIPYVLYEQTKPAIRMQVHMFMKSTLCVFPKLSTVCFDLVIELAKQMQSTCTHKYELHINYDTH